MRPVFLDTVGLLAIWDEGDQWHSAATAAFEELVAAKTHFVCTSYIIAECANATARALGGRACVERLVCSLEKSRGLAFPSDANWHEAWTRYLAGHPGAPGLVDEISFAVMRRLGLRRAFTNDRHLADAGFEVLF